MDSNQSGTAQMETNAHQEDHPMKVEGETQLLQQGLDNTQHAKGCIHNGEY